MESSAHTRGAYYTPPRLAEILCAWAVRRGDRVLDPACGDGVFLKAAKRIGATVEGIELDAASARLAGARCGDFFDSTSGRRYDAVVGNPPYVHFTRRSGQHRAREIAGRLGLRFGSGASLWAPFLAAAAEHVRPGGRMAMVIPREMLFVDYAHALLAHLKSKFPRIEIISITSFVFPGALEKVAVLLCEPGTPSFRIREVRDLDGLTPDFINSREASEPSLAWTRVPREVRDIARRALDRMTPLSDLADVNIGIVTGDKEFFLVNGGLPSIPVVASPTWISGATLTTGDLRNRPRLLDVAADYAGGNPAIDAYLAEGRRRGVHKRYKCAERACWWRPRIGERPPDAFLAYLSDRLPRLTANPARAFCTNNLHRVFFKRPLAIGAFYNPVTLLSVELGGRVLGDSALKLEPGDAGKVRVPIAKHDPLDAVDRALRAGDETLAFRIASDAAGLSTRERNACSRAHAALRDLRMRERRMKA